MFIIYEKLHQCISVPKKRFIILVLLILFILLIFPLFSSQYFIHMLIMTFMTASAVLSWTLIGGFTGQISLGHVVFFGIGAYSVGILHATYRVSPWAGMLIGVFLSIILTLIIGWPTFKLAGHYFALATIAIPSVFFYLSKYFDDFTYGSGGISLVNKPGIADMMFDSKLPWYYITLALLLCIIYILYRIKESKLGYYLFAIKEDEVAASSIGVNPTYYKQIALSISAVFISVIGSLYICYTQYISPTEAFDVNRGIYWAIISIIGGSETIFGPLLSAFVLEPVSLLLGNFIGGAWGPFSNIIYGSILILVIILRPQGILSKEKDIFNFEK